MIREEAAQVAPECKANSQDGCVVSGIPYNGLGIVPLYSRPRIPMNNDAQPSVYKPENQNMQTMTAEIEL
jgi:hypothetical protein